MQKSLGIPLQHSHRLENRKSDCISICPQPFQEFLFQAAWKNFVRKKETIQRPILPNPQFMYSKRPLITSKLPDEIGTHFSNFQNISLAEKDFFFSNRLSSVLRKSFRTLTSQEKDKAQQKQYSFNCLPFILQHQGFSQLTKIVEKFERNITNRAPQSSCIAQ